MVLIPSGRGCSRVWTTLMTLEAARTPWRWPWTPSPHWGLFWRIWVWWNPSPKLTLLQHPCHILVSSLTPYQWGWAFHLRRLLRWGMKFLPGWRNPLQARNLFSNCWENSSGSVDASGSADPSWVNSCSSWRRCPTYQTIRRQNSPWSASKTSSGGPGTSADSMG